MSSGLLGRPPRTYNHTRASQLFNIKVGYNKFDSGNGRRGGAFISAWLFQENIYNNLASVASLSYLYPFPFGVFPYFPYVCRLYVLCLVFVFFLLVFFHSPSPVSFIFVFFQGCVIFFRWCFFFFRLTSVFHMVFCQMVFIFSLLLGFLSSVVLSSSAWRFVFFHFDIIYSSIWCIAISHLVTCRLFVVLFSFMCWPNLRYFFRLVLRQVLSSVFSSSN